MAINQQWIRQALREKVKKEKRKKIQVQEQWSFSLSSSGVTPSASQSWCWYLSSSSIIVLPGGWVRRQLCELLSALFQRAVHHLPTVRQLLLLVERLASWLLLQALFTENLHGEQLLAPPPSSGVLIAPLLLCCVYFSVPCLLFSFYFCGVGVHLSRGLCWFIPVAHAVCFLPLVTMLDPVSLPLLSLASSNHHSTLKVYDIKYFLYCICE
jgi:hypothetical protein